ncbi:TPA: hypothetical protein DCX16_01660 [bacterium]|nr:hypothetical protein [bacterium]
MKIRIRWIMNRISIILPPVFLFLFIFLIVLQHAKITNLRYEISYLEENLNKEKRKERSLLIEIGRLSSEERIQELAEKYELVLVKPKQITFLPQPLFQEADKPFYKQGLLAMIFKNVEAKEK